MNRRKALLTFVTHIMKEIILKIKSMVMVLMFIATAHRILVNGFLVYGTEMEYYDTLTVIFTVVIS